MTNLQLEQCIETFRSSYLEMEANYDKLISDEIRYEGFKPYRIAAETSFMQMVEKSTLEYEEFLSCAFHRLLEVPTSKSCNKIEVDSFAEIPAIFQLKFLFLLWVIKAFPPKRDIVPLLCFVAEKWLFTPKPHMYWRIILYILEAISSQDIKVVHYHRLYEINKKVLADLRRDTDDYFTMDLAYEISNLAYVVRTEEMKELVVANIDHPVERLAEELKETLELLNKK